MCGLLGHDGVGARGGGAGEPGGWAQRAQNSKSAVRTVFGKPRWEICPRDQAAAGKRQAPGARHQAMQLAKTMMTITKVITRMKTPKMLMARTIVVT